MRGCSKDNPDLIFTEPIDINVGLTPEAASRMASNMDIEEGTEEEGTESHEKAIKLITNLYDMSGM